MPYRFIIYTWLLTIPANTLFILLVFPLKAWLTYGNAHLGLYLDPDIILTIATFSTAFSLPGLLGLFVLARLANEFFYEAEAGFFFISAGAAGITLFCYILLEFILTLHMTFAEYLPFVFASLLSVAFALYCTRNHYYSHYKLKA